MTVKVYSAESPLLNPRRFLEDAWKDLLSSRSTAAWLFRQSIAQRYRYSTFGLLWVVAPPAITALLVTVMKSGGHHLLQSGAPDLVSPAHVPPQFYAVFGLTLGQTFLETFGTQRKVFSSNRILLSRQKATVEGLILAGVIDSLFRLAIKLAILAGFFMYFRIQVAPTLPLGLIGIAGIFLLGSALGLLIAPVSALQLDMDNAMTFFPWMLFGLTPVFVPAIPGAGLYSIYHYNPFTWIFDATRAFSYGHPQGYGLTLLVVSIVSPCLFLFAALYCRISRSYVLERFLV